MSLVKIDWNPDRVGYRKFGVAVFVGFSLIGALSWLAGGSLAATRATGHMVWGPLPFFTLVPAAVLLLSIVAPRACRPLYMAWMAAAFVMGTIMSNVLLAFIYWVLFGAIATIFRLRRRDRLVLRDPLGASIWSEAGTVAEKDRYVRQF
ncbi:MAG TPA: SxtJ family membrane protein [Planctomycetota bacterium]|nr:SxtJ family membrane protein [Planctomycetota bacterium]